MKLKRTLGFWDVFCLAAGAMISSGLFVLPGLAFQKAGPAVVLSYTMAALLMIPAMLSQAELSTAMPRSGGSYFFIERSMGALPGTLAGMANWFSIALKSAFALIGIGALARLLAPGAGEWAIKSVAIAACAAFTVMNLLSVKGTGRLQIAMAALLIALLGMFLVFGLPAVHHSRFAGFMDEGPWAIFATAGLVFVSFGGLTKVASVAGEIRHPGRNIPAGMFAASMVISLLYVAAVFVTVGATEPGRLAGNLTPLSTAAGQTSLAAAGAVLLGAAALLAFFTTANGGILAASRSPMAMSQDGLLPAFMQRVSRRFQTPWVSILLTGGFMAAVIALLHIEQLVKVASTMMLMLFLMVNVSVLIMRSSRIQNYRPLFHSPMYPWLQVAGILVYGLLIAAMGATALLTTAAFGLAGVLWYLAYVRTRISRESAFVYMVKNIVSKDIYRSGLEEELREIAFERDEVIHDKFDHLVQECAILDIPESVTAEQLFRRSAGALAPRLDMDEKHLEELLLAREADSSTVIQPGLAIPHIVVAGAGRFEILLVRCKGGVIFPGQAEPVRAAFVLAGSADQRNYHLKALMAIAHIVQEAGFERRWLAAAGGEHLRDLVLLSQRERQA